MLRSSSIFITRLPKFLLYFFVVALLLGRSDSAFISSTSGNNISAQKSKTAVQRSILSKGRKITFNTQLCMQVPGLEDTTISMGGIPLVPVASGLESVLALIAGHVPGVLVGALSLAVSLFKNNDAVQDAVPFSTETIATPLSIWVGLLLGVRLATLAPDTRYAEFPNDVAAPAGCTRVASDFTNNKGKLSVPKFKDVTVEELQGDIKGWILSQPRSKIFVEEEGYIHAQVLSNLMGFPDNLGVKIFKNNNGETEVWLQGELRVGGSDLGVNYNRVKALLEFLETKTDKSK